MDLGAIVEYGGHAWRICKRDGNVRTVTLIRWGGTTEEIADDDPGAVVVADPSTWPVVTARVKPTAGRITKLSMTRGGKSQVLKPLVDWVPSDFTRAGGSIFLCPALKLAVGEILIAEYERGNSTRILITKRYGTMAERKIVRSGLSKKKTLMDFLDGDEFVE